MTANSDISLSCISWRKPEPHYFQLLIYYIFSNQFHLFAPMSTHRQIQHGVLSLVPLFSGVTQLLHCFSLLLFHCVSPPFLTFNPAVLFLLLSVFFLLPHYFHLIPVQPFFPLHVVPPLFSSKLKCGN